MAGWLHRTTQNLSANAIRSDVRRRAREQQAAAMNDLLAGEPDALWESIAPHLDAALSELNDSDREAVLQRYFQRKSSREMSLSLGVSTEAAQKRVNRAVDRLRELFAQRGIAIGANGLIVFVTANAMQAAPSGLVATISAAALVAAPIKTSAAVATAKIIAMTTLQKTLVVSVIAAALGPGSIKPARPRSTAIRPSGARPRCKASRPFLRAGRTPWLPSTLGRCGPPWQQRPHRPLAPPKHRPLCHLHRPTCTPC
jgi:hypothetical protein